MPAFADDRSGEITAALETLPAGGAAAAVATRLLDLFTDGSIAAGTRLPPERQLAVVLGVGRSAVREALAALEILGVVDVRPGSGTYLRGSTSELLPQSLSWGVLLSRDRTRDLIEVRTALETHAARLAAERLDDDHLAALADRLRDMEARLGDLPAFVEADLGFHHLLASGTGNTLLLDLLQIVRSLLRVWADRAVQAPDQASTAVREHTAVLDALRRRDPDAAAAAMAAHMATAGRRLAAGDRA